MVCPWTLETEEDKEAPELTAGRLAPGEPEQRAREERAGRIRKY